MPTTKLQLGNIQGNSIGGFSKDFQTNLFLKFTNAANGRAWIQEISGEIAGSSSADVLDFNRQFAALTKQGVQRPEELISAVWVNLAFSFRGLAALKLKNRDDLDLFPQTFREGMAKAKSRIGDVGRSDPSTWIKPFNKSRDLHAVLIIAADHSVQLQEKVAAVTRTAAFKAGVEILLDQVGRTRSDLPGHEHFGFKDGVSQPGIRGVDPPDDPIANPNQGHPGQDLLWPGEFIVGYATQIPKGKTGVDGPNPDPGPDFKPDPGWTVDGSYLVFRRLKQDVVGFERQVKELAKKLGWSTDLTGAKLVGRYKSGTPIEQRRFQPTPYTPPSTDPGDPHHGNPALGSNNTLNNNFEFSGDTDGAICPLAAHIRKAYPRDELNTGGNSDGESLTQTHRLLRRGIPYGEPFVAHDPASGRKDRGLLFLCYQNDIASHFEFVQSNWVNNPRFPPGPAVPGEDPIITQTTAGKMLIDPNEPAIEVSHFVTTTGGEYFFAPSISALQGIADGSI